MSIDRFLGRRRTPTYDCATFAAEVLADRLGGRVLDALRGLVLPTDPRVVTPEHRRCFERLARPADWCLVYGQAKHGAHVGVWLRNKVLHLPERGPVLWQPLREFEVCFKSVRFYACR